MREYTKIEVRCRDDDTQSWQSIAPYSARLEVGDNLETVLQDLACYHWRESEGFPIEVRWNYMGSLQGHYYTPTKPDPIVDIEIRIPRDDGVVVYRCVVLESQIELALKYYIDIHESGQGAPVTRCRWRYAGSQVYQFYEVKEKSNV